MKKMKTVQCPACSGICNLTIRDYHGDASSTPKLSRVQCRYCNSIGIISVPEEWSHDKYLRDVKEKIYLKKTGQI